MYQPGAWTQNNSATVKLATTSVYANDAETTFISSFATSELIGESRSGYRTAGWPLKGTDTKPVNPASCNTWDWDWTTTSFWGTFGGNRKIRNLLLIPGGYPFHLGVSADTNEMKRRFYNSVRGVSWNAMQTFAESAESVGTLRSLSKGLLNSVVSFVNFRRNSIRNFSRLVDTLAQPAALRSKSARKYLREFGKENSNRWLEYTYGVAPMIGDIHDARNALGQDLTVRRSRVRGRVSAVQQSVSVATMFADTIPFDVTIRHTTKNQITGFGLIVDTPAPGLGNVATSLGLSWSNVVPTVYELIPYSFVVDYFSNIGDVLTAACTPTENISAQGTTAVSESVISFSGVPRRDVTVYRTYPPFTARCEYFSFTRTPGAVGMPTLEFKVPLWDSKKWLNLGALAGARIL